MKLFCLSVSCLALLSSVIGVNRKPAVQFCDATQTAKLRFQHCSATTPQKYLLEIMGGGVAVFDYDNDGAKDLFCTNSHVSNNVETT